jgi:hypothetical protein
MQYILFIMFLITPPTAGKDPDWALQNTNSMVFQTWAACNNAAQDIITSIKKTKTITAVAWCFEKTTSSEVGAQERSRRDLPKRPSQRLQLD